MKKYLKFLSLLPLAAVIILGLSFAKHGSLNSDKVSPNTRVVKEYKANLTVKLNGEEKSYDLSQFIGSSLLEAMEKAGIKIEKSGEGENAFITGIEGRLADAKKREFWELVVNSKQAEVGAGTLKIQNGDKIEWKINTY